MYSSDTTKNKNAFSLAEKQYRMRVLETIRVDAKTGRRRKRGTLVEEIDLSDAIDFFEFSHSESSSVMRVSEKEEEEKKRAKTCKKAKGGVEPRVWKLLDHPGAYYVENALDFREQRALIAHCVKRLPERPNKTNHWQRLGETVAGGFVSSGESGFVFERGGKRVDGVRETSETRRRDGIESGEAFVEEITLGYGWGTVRLDEESLRGRASAGG